MTSIPMSCALDAAQNLRTQVASLAEYPNTDRPSGESAHRIATVADAVERSP